jgi:hypothetical protein
MNADLANAMTSEPLKKWRRGYQKNFVKLTEECAKSSAKAFACAKAGLDHLHTNITFIRDGQEIPLKDAMKKLQKTRKFDIEMKMHTKQKLLDFIFI